MIEGYTKWIINWKRNGWKTSSGKSVQNLDLWQKIDELRINGLVMEYVRVIVVTNKMIELIKSQLTIAKVYL